MRRALTLLLLLALATPAHAGWHFHGGWKNKAKRPKIEIIQVAPAKEGDAHSARVLEHQNRSEHWSLDNARPARVTSVGGLHLMTRDAALAEGIGKDGKRCVMADGSPCKRRSGRPNWRMGQGTR